MNIPSLKHFVDSVPLLPQENSLSKALDRLLETQSDRAIVLTEGGTAIGVLSLVHLLPALSSSASKERSQQSLSTLNEAGVLLLQSLAILPEDWSLRRVLPCLQSAEALHWGIADTSGQLLGLLNCTRFWQFWATCGVAVQTPPASNHELLAQVDYGDALSPLEALIEPLPIPLMVQASGGEAFAENLAWRQQFGEFNHLTPMGREAAIALKSALAEPSFRLENWQTEDSSAACTPDFSLPSDSNEWETLIKSTGHDRQPFCRPGAAPQTCICFDPSSSGRDRVWKLIRSPIPETLVAPPVSGPLWLVLAQDITEQYQLSEEMASKTAELIQLNRFKDEFLACISHELKTPLTAVLGLSGLLKDQLKEGLSDRQLRYTQLIHQSGRHLMLIVNDILDLTRIETGQLELMPSMVSLESVCLRAYEQACQIQATDPEVDSSQKVSFDLKIQFGLSSIIADEVRLRQMLSNLLSNAMKFTPTGGHIGLSVEAWGDWIAFTVWDTGIGIPPEKQYLIFQKFQQLENALTRRFEGTGLGLALTQRLARLHGGDVTFTSIQGKGSRFTLLLPAPPQSALKQSGKMAEAAARRLVLLVEAEPSALDGLSQLLAQTGYQVVIARSGTEALEKIRHLQPAVVLLNPLLPLLSGWDVLTLVKSNSETRNIPIIVMGTMADKERATSSRANGFLRLPIHPDSLQQQLEALSGCPAFPVTTTFTILHLQTGHQPRLPELTHRLHPYPCRVVEVDDLDQAELLTRVWKPQLVLLDGTLSNPSAYMEQLSTCSVLVNLPLITLTVENTQAANQVPGLIVFPCLISTTSPEALDSDITALLQVMQVATGLD